MQYLPQRWIIHWSKLVKSIKYAYGHKKLYILQILLNIYPINSWKCVSFPYSPNRNHKKNYYFSNYDVIRIKSKQINVLICLNKKTWIYIKHWNCLFKFIFYIFIIWEKFTNISQLMHQRIRTYSHKSIVVKSLHFFKKKVLKTILMN